MAVSLGELAVRFGCELRGDPDIKVERVATLGGAERRRLSFLANPRYRAQLAATRAAAVVLNADAAADCPTAMLVSENPYVTYARIAALLHPLPPLAPGVHPTALVAASARIDPSAQVAAFAMIGENVVIEARSFVGPHSLIEAGVRLAADVRLVARVTLGAAYRSGRARCCSPARSSAPMVLASRRSAAAGSRCRSSARCRWAPMWRSAPTRLSIAGPSRTR